jgi:hypothetical protein
LIYRRDADNVTITMVAHERRQLRPEDVG